jgi:hypothetical protein
MFSRIEIPLELFNWKIVIYEFVFEDEYLTDSKKLNESVIEFTKLLEEDKHPKDTIKEITDSIEGTKPTSGSAFNYLNEGVYYTFVLLDPNKSFGNNINTVVHELTHITDGIMGCVHIDSQETKAYINGYLIEKYLDSYNCLAIKKNPALIEYAAEEYFQECYPCLHCIAGYLDDTPCNCTKGIDDKLLKSKLDKLLD